MMGLAPAKPLRQPLARLLAGFDVGDVPDAEIAQVTVDSRAARPGSLFMAYQGTRAHGLDHADDAVARGARAVVWDRERAPVLDVPHVRVPDLVARASRIAARAYGEPAQRLFVTGVTGTDGKTSCAWLLARALDALGTRCGYLGTLGFGFTDDLAEASHTTPDAVAVQDWLARFVTADAAAVAFEVSSHALDQHRVDGVAFDVAVLTQVGRDHLDYHGDAAAYAAAKRRLFTLDGLRYAILNADDALGRAWLEELADAVTPVAYGSGDVSHLAAHYVGLRTVRARADGLEIEIDSHAGAARIETGLIGRFNAANLAAVLAVLLVRGIPVAAAAAVLAEARTVPGRMERIPGRADQPLVVVDYAHTPNALAQALAAVAEHAAGRVFCVFGCGGDRDSGKRALMGEAAARGADVLWLTDDNPRHEVPAAIVADIRAGIADDVDVTVRHDRAEAIGGALAAARDGDVVLIAGKGHETSQQIGDTRRAFDDRVVARRALGAV